jgi:exosortase
MASPGARGRLSLPPIGSLFLLVALWTWAIWACAEHWRGNPNYSYGWAVPVLAVGFGVRRFLRLRDNDQAAAGKAPGWITTVLSLVALASLGGALEYGRETMWHPEIVLWSICLLCVGLTLATLGKTGGWSLARAELFPTLFFLSAVPWPPRFEQPLTAALMRSVADGTTEILHWLGIEAIASGGAIALHSGLVGITEACSGIRSLQAGVMFGLAMGEWFLLRFSRRVVLLVLAIVLALATNLGRTLTLSLQAERHGVGSVEGIHDLTGNIAVTSLVLAIALLAKLLAGRRGSAGGVDRPPVFRSPSLVQSSAFALAAISLLAGIFTARVLYARGEGNGYSQKAPRFAVRAGPESAARVRPVPADVWNELRPTSGEYVRQQEIKSGTGAVDCFHFFWKPSVWNRFALVHRPDICMPGIGWTEVGVPQPVTVSFNGHDVSFYLFHFRRGTTHALEIWGAWRNGVPVPLDYSPDQVLGTGATPAFLKMNGKRRSATEILACSLLSDGAEPSRELAVALLPAVFDYKDNE